MLGDYFIKKLNSINTNKVSEIREEGLFIGIELHKSVGLARPYCEALMEKGMLCKETHDYVIRLAPPLIVEKADIDWMVDQLAEVLKTNIVLFRPL
jgi:ornithine--oxo-acid transaminase